MPECASPQIYISPITKRVLTSEQAKAIILASKALADESKRFSGAIDAFSRTTPVTPETFKKAAVFSTVFNHMMGFQDDDALNKELGVGTIGKTRELAEKNLEKIGLAVVSNQVMEVSGNNLTGISELTSLVGLEKSKTLLQITATGSFILVLTKEKKEVSINHTFCGDIVTETSSLEVVGINKNKVQAEREHQVPITVHVFWIGETTRSGPAIRRLQELGLTGSTLTNVLAKRNVTGTRVFTIPDKKVLDQLKDTGLKDEGIETLLRRKVSGVILPTRDPSEVIRSVRDKISGVPSVKFSKDGFADFSSAAADLFSSGVIEWALGEVEEKLTSDSAISCSLEASADSGPDIFEKASSALNMVISIIEEAFSWILNKIREGVEFIMGPISTVTSNAQNWLNKLGNGIAGSLLRSAIACFLGNSIAITIPETGLTLLDEFISAISETAEELKAPVEAIMGVLAAFQGPLCLSFELIKPFLPGGSTGIDFLDSGLNCLKINFPLPECILKILQLLIDVLGLIIFAVDSIVGFIQAISGVLRSLLSQLRFDIAAEAIRCKNEASEQVLKNIAKLIAS